MPLYRVIVTTHVEAKNENEAGWKVRDAIHPLPIWDLQVEEGQKDAGG